MGARKTVGRPKNTDGLELVTLDECLRRAAEYLGLEGPPWTKRTLQNRISAGLYQRYGTYHRPEVDWGEVRRSLHWKRKTG
jgi:hypothetical protein